MTRSVALVIALLCPFPAAADDWSRFVKTFDPPSAVKHVKPKSNADPVGEIACTYYPDLMVRESGVDTPDPSIAVLVPLTAGGARPPCRAGRIAGQLGLATEGYGFVGRKGPFLVWDATDPNGAVPFMVINAVSGRILFQDSISPVLGTSREVTLGHGLLRLRYTRAFNAPCSMIKDASGCGSRLLAEGKVSPRVSPPKACAAAYNGVEADDPSAILYKVQVTVDARGKTRVLPVGAAYCMPQP